MSGTSTVLITAGSSLAVGVLAATAALAGGRVQRKAEFFRERRQGRRDVYNKFMDKFDLAENHLKNIWNARLPLSDIDMDKELEDLNSSLNRILLEGPDTVVAAGREAIKSLYAERGALSTFAQRALEESGGSHYSLATMAGNVHIDLSSKTAKAKGEFILSAMKVVNSRN